MIFFGNQFVLTYLSYSVRFDSIPVSLSQIDNQRISTCSLLGEPLMAIKNKQSHNQIGLMYECGPDVPLYSPKEIKVGVLCPMEDREKLGRFLEKLINGVPVVQGKLDNLVSNYQGFSSLTKINMKITGDREYQPSLSSLTSLAQDQLIEFIISWIKRIEEKTHPDLYLIFFPIELEKFRNVDGVDFHDRLKFRCLSSYKTQLIDEKKSFKENSDICKTLFNLAVAIYTKTIGMPWKPVEYNPNKFFLGMAFGQSKNGINLSCSQLFDGAGRGMKLLVSPVSNKM
jgi:hypothetical protein